LPPMTRTQLLVRLDGSPWNEVSRAVIGFIALPVFVALFGTPTSGRTLYLFYLGLLLALRLVPAVIRRLVPFSNDVRVLWAERRVLAKRYDSYQWQKLFWLGLGLGSYVVLFGVVWPPALILTSACVLSGAVGLAVWLSRKAHDELEKPPAAQVCANT
jgi:hypothetical protein